MFPKTEPLWKQLPISRALLSTYFVVPSKGTLLTGSPQKAPKDTERDASFPDPFFIRPSKPPVNEPSSNFAGSVPMGKDALLQSFLLRKLQGPQ